METNDELLRLLRAIHEVQLEESRRATTRWRIVAVVVGCCGILAVPAIVTYLHHWLVYTF